jgi:pimeloyl-ACP methyl ester carboxylesterase
MPDARHLHDGAMGLLRAGDGYRIAYAAAFRYKGAQASEAISQLRVPTAIVACEDDLLYGHLERLPGGLPPGVRDESLPRDRESWAKWLADFWAGNTAEGELPPAIAAASIPDLIVKDYVDTSQGQLITRRRDDAQGRPLVLLHASPGSAVMLEPLMQELAPRRPVIAFDTLGNGDSDAAGWKGPWIGDYAKIVNEALDALDLEHVDLYGTHTGALIAVETAIARPERVGGLVLDGVTLWDEEFRDELLARYTLPLAPRDDGTHLISAWNFVRDVSLFWPHYNRTREGIRWVEPLDVEALHARVVEVLKSCETYQIAYHAALAYPTRERLPLLNTRTLILSAEGDMLGPYTDEAARLAPNAVAWCVPVGGVATAIEEFLSDAPQPARPVNEE